MNYLGNTEQKIFGSLLKGSVNLRNIRDAFGLVHQIEGEIAVMVVPVFLELVHRGDESGEAWLPLPKVILVNDALMWFAILVWHTKPSCCSAHALDAGARYEKPKRLSP
jgi:hypothetical protein